MFTIIQFSPTGNAAYVASLFKAALSVSKAPLALEHTDPKTLEKDEHLILVYAIHAFNAPRTVHRFISNLPKGLYNKVSLIGVGCNTSWANSTSSKAIRKTLENKSYKIYTDTVVTMPLTFIMKFPDDMIKLQLSEILDTVKNISLQLTDSAISQNVIPFKSKIVTTLGHAEPFASRLFGLELHAKKSCTKCGLCSRECPEKNIKMTEAGNIKFGFKCIMCMRCIYNCPVNAITPRISKFIPIKGGYSLEKILDQQIENPNEVNQ